MACNTFSTVSLDCMDGVSGIETLYIMQYSNVDTTSGVNGITTSAGTQTVTDIAYTNSGATEIFQEIQINDGSGSLEGARELSLENGSQGRTYDLTFSIGKNESAVLYELDRMEKNRLIVIIKSNNGRYYLLGKRRGALCTGGSHTIGAALTDLNGITYTISSFETQLAPEVSSTYITTSNITFA